MRILVNGANGKMGRETVAAISADTNLQLVGQINKQDNLAETIKSSQAQVVVDFTVAGQGFKNTKAILEANAHPVIGTSGFSADEIAELKQIAQAKKLGGIIAPNFSIGAVMMMQCAKQCAQYFPAVEIIEMHHDHKVDAPSGTAIKTAELIQSAKQPRQYPVVEHESLSGARGGSHDDIRIHSVRLPGFVASQEVIFGGNAETLKIRHDTIDRSSFMPGVVLACKKVGELDELVYGLEHVL